MKILIAGATGAIGRPIVDLLIREGHDVYGVTQSKEKALSLFGQGVKSVILDILNKKNVFSALESVEPDVVIDMLTHLPKEYTPDSMKAAAELDEKTRIEGGGNLLAAAINSRTRRYIAQSSGFWYAPGIGLADESTPFAFDATPGIASGCRLYEKIEQRVLETDQIEGVALRFGFFYGPGTWFNPDGNVAEQIRKHNFPVVGNGEGVWNFVHIQDAAKAVVTAVYSNPGIYNIINDNPSPMKKWLPAFARFLEAKPPGTITEEEAMREKGADWVYYATKLRAASNAKARRLLDFQPRSFEWLL